MKLLLEAGELFEPERSKVGQVLRCEAGRCWLTVAGYSRDLILRPGQQYDLPVRKRVVVTALTEVRIQLFEKDSESTVFGAVNWLAWLKKRALA